MKKIVIAGGGGHAKVMINAIRLAGEYRIVGIVDPALDTGSKVLGVTVLGGDEELPSIYNSGVGYAALGVGSVGDCSLRKKVSKRIIDAGFTLPVIAHPDAVVADDVRVGEGTFIAAGVVVNPGATIGRFVIVNTSSSVDHDCVIGDNVHIAPGVTLSGGVRVGCDSHIGTGSSVIQDIKIGPRCIVRAGSTVTKDFNAKE